VLFFIIRKDILKLLKSGTKKKITNCLKNPISIPFIFHLKYMGMMGWYAICCSPSCRDLLSKIISLCDPNSTVKVIYFENSPLQTFSLTINEKYCFSTFVSLLKGSQIKPFWMKKPNQTANETLPVPKHGATEPIYKVNRRKSAYRKRARGRSAALALKWKVWPFNSQWIDLSESMRPDSLRDR